MASSPQHEPTMEEILASIRKIISEDTTDAAPEPEAKPAAAAAPEADVLELTQEVDEPPPPAAAAPVPTPAPPAPAPAAPIHAENDVVFETIEEPVMSNPAPAAHEDDGIFSDKTRKALDETFAGIDTPEEEPAPVASQPIAVPPVDGRTVEAVFERAVREAFGPVVNEWLGTHADTLVEKMKPLIREWMDEHFPALLEGAVRNEVARVVKARGAAVKR